MYSHIFIEIAYFAKLSYLGRVLDTAKVLALLRGSLIEEPVANLRIDLGGLTLLNLHALTNSL